MPNLRDSGSYSTSNPPVTDPALALVATATSTSGNAVLTYTTTGAHNLVVGQPVSISGLTGAYSNFDPTANSSTANGTVAQVASVTSSTVFTVTSPLGTSVSTSVSATTGGTVSQQALVSKSPYGSSTKTQSWLPPTAVDNVQIDRAWGKELPIQPNDDRQAGVAVSAATASGTQISLTVGSGHGIVAGQIIHMQGFVPNSVNVRHTVASTGATNVTVNSTFVGTIDATNGAIEPAITSGGYQIAVASATGATAATKTLTITTAQPHGLISGQTASVVGGTNANYNVQNAVVTTTGAKTFTVPANTSQIIGVSGTAGTGVVGDGTNVRYTTLNAHGLASGDKVNIFGFTPTGYNATDASVISAGLSANTFAIANTATAAVTVLGIAIEQSGTFAGTAYVSTGDNGWGQAYTVRSGNLVPGLDSHEINTTSRSGYPTFAPTFPVPTVTGKTLTNAVQALRSAGLKQGNLTFATDLTATVGTTSSQVTFTTSAAHNLAIGDTVNFSSATTATVYNFGDVVVGQSGVTTTGAVSISGTNQIIVQGVFTAATDSTLKIRPKNLLVTAQATSTTDATVVDLTRNYGL